MNDYAYDFKFLVQGDHAGPCFVPEILAANRSALAPPASPPTCTLGLHFAADISGT